VSGVLVSARRKEAGNAGEAEEVTRKDISCWEFSMNSRFAQKGVSIAAALVKALAYEWPLPLTSVGYTVEV
jgi:hypothetical protein